MADRKSHKAKLIFSKFIAPFLNNGISYNNLQGGGSNTPFYMVVPAMRDRGALNNTPSPLPIRTAPCGGFLNKFGENIMANPVGRPRLYKSVEEFDQKVQEFKAFCEERDEPATWTGLCLFMGFSCRASLDEYANYPEFSYSVKKAKTFIEYEYEKKLHAGNSTGAIFALKNFGWSDKQDVNHTSEDGSMSPTRPASEMTDDELAAIAAAISKTE